MFLKILIALQYIKMEYQKIANLLDNVLNQPSKFKTRNWVEINNESKGTYTGDSTKLITTMRRSNLCDYADAYITGDGDNDAAKIADERDKGVIFKNCEPFTKCIISRTNNTEIDNAKDIDIVMPMYNLIEYSDNYSKTSGSLWQHCKDNPNDNLTDSESFKSKIKITGKAPNNGNTKDVEIIAPLKYLSNFWNAINKLWSKSSFHLV